MNHDPQAVLDYSFDWSSTPPGATRGYLDAGETITAFTVTKVTGDVVLGISSQAGGVVKQWVSGGTVGTRSTLTCHITTSAGRKDDRTISLDVRNR